MRAFVFFLVGFNAIQALAQTTFVQATPALTPSPVFSPGSPALTPAAVTPGGPTTNSTLTALSESLVSLQTSVQQALPLLTSFNDNFDFISLSGTSAAATPAHNPPGNFAVNLGVNFATNLAVNTAVPTGGSLFNAPANAAAQIPPGISQGVATIPVTRHVLRALLVLQSDLQRMMPLLNALNGGATNLPGSFTNLFGVSATSP